jgi:hypothetical protein
MLKNSLILCAMSLILAGCGGYGSSSYSGGNGGNNTGQAQGVYSGTSSSGYAFSAIVLPNDKFYIIYNTATGNPPLLLGLITGQGISASTTYSASATDFYYTGTTNSGSISASYVAGVSVNGTLTENGTMTTYNATAQSASSFNYNTAASLSSITGTWTGTLLDGINTTVAINPDGTVSGSSAGCTFAGTVAADSSNKNFFDVSLTFGASPCANPNQTATGVGFEYLLSDGVTHQLLAAVTVGTTAGTVFAARK